MSRFLAQRSETRRRGETPAGPLDDEFVSAPIATPQHAGLVFLSQALLSGLAFFTSILFIAFASKSEFGIYGMVYAAILLSGGVQNALILTPMTVSAPAFADGERPDFIRRLAAAQGAVCVLLALAFGGTILAIGQGNGVWLGVSSALALAGAWSREFRRTERLLDGRFTRLLLGDTALVVLAGAGIGAVVIAGKPLTAALGLAITGLAGLVTGAPRAWTRLATSTERSRVWQTMVALRGQIQWTVPGVAVTWLQGNAYAYVVGLSLGAARVADINTARTVIAPAVLALTAWNRYQLPRIASAMGRGGSGEILKHAKRSRLWVATGAALYAAAAISAIAWFGDSKLLGKYASTGEIAVPWLVFLLFSGVRSTASIPLLARSEFRLVFLFTASSAVVTLLATVGLASTHGPSAVVWAVAGGEAILAWLCWKGMTRRAEPAIAEFPLRE